jgi:antitoxin component YwqK of YwqJK toxin-antitoxin module
MISRMRLAPVFVAVMICWPVGCRHNAKQVAIEQAANQTEMVEEHWPNGGLRSRAHMLKDPDGTAVYHGAYERWYPEGQKEYEAFFIHGRKDGVATLYHKNGRKWTEEHYVDGKRHGLRIVWDGSGTKRKEENHFDGKPHGQWTVWDKHGKIKWQTMFEHGTPKP